MKAKYNHMCCFHQAVRCGSVNPDLARVSRVCDIPALFVEIHMAQLNNKCWSFSFQMALHSLQFWVYYVYQTSSFLDKWQPDQALEAPLCSTFKYIQIYCRQSFSSMLCVYFVYSPAHNLSEVADSISNNGGGVESCN